MTDFPVSGGCVCGSVRYTVSGAADFVVHCHCSLCRRTYAGLVATGASIEKKHLKIDKGENNLSTYPSPSNARRQFCRTCGCSLFYYLDDTPEIMYYYPATLDRGVHPGHPDEEEYHAYVGSKASWENFDDDLPKFSEGKV